MNIDLTTTIRPFRAAVRPRRRSPSSVAAFFVVAAINYGVGGITIADAFAPPASPATASFSAVRSRRIWPRVEILPPFSTEKRADNRFDHLPALAALGGGESDAVANALASLSVAHGHAAAPDNAGMDYLKMLSENFEILHNPTLWSIAAMSCIVGLLVAWEEMIDNIKEATPRPIVPVIDSMLAEVGGLGFIGLFLSTVVTGGPMGGVIGRISEDFLGDEELLLETFEFLHTFFFEVGILFFVCSGIVVGAVLQRVQSLSEISALALDTDGDGEVTLEELADALHVESLIVDADGDGVITPAEVTDALRRSNANGVFEDLSLGANERAAECLVLRERMLQQLKLPQTFRIEYYFAEIFGENLKEIVELSPVTWIPLIPLIALDNSVDISRDVVSASSANAFDSCGYFFATPWVLYSTLFLQAFSLFWAVFNFYKVTSIKAMLLPTLVRDRFDNAATLLPPRVEDPVLRAEYAASQEPRFLFDVVDWVEGLVVRNKIPPRNEHEELFGSSGSSFPRLYRDSIRFHTWLCVAQIVYSTTQIIFRDGAALYLGASEVGNPEGLMPEFVLWSLITASAIFQLSLAPTTFLNYCVITSVERYVKKNVIVRAIRKEQDDAMGDVMEECISRGMMTGMAGNGGDMVAKALAEASTKEEVSF